jgi:micrococcal nuclease
MVMVGAGTRRSGPWLTFVALLGMTVGCDSDATARAVVDLTASEQLTVERVVDGDTVDLRNGLRVRVLGIDTPERVDPNTPVECWGPQATEFARATLEGEPVTIAGDPTQAAVDRYGRTLAYLTLADGRDYSVLAAGAGMARAYTFDRPVQKAPQIEAAEAEARAAGRGLWGAGCPDEAADSSTTATTPPTSAVKTAVVVPAQAAVATTTHRRATPPSTPVATPAVPAPDVARTVKTTPKPMTEKATQPAATTKKTTTTTAANPSGGCDPNYSGCVPIASDVDCAGGSGNGPAYVSGPVRVIGTDVYGLDADKDRLACE